MLRLIARFAVAAALAATAYAAAPAAPVSAAGCATADGVTVVVDFHELGGGVQSACVAGGGGDRASSLFPAAGFGLDYVQRQPGFVCRVAGKPADNPCVNTPPATAYWGLWWSDGKSGRWTYATSGASGLSVPDGGYVAFSWNGSSDSSPPGTTPAVHAAPTPTPEPTKQPTKNPTAQPGGSGSSSPASDSPSASASSEAAGPSGSASASASDRASKQPRKPGKGASASASRTAERSAEESAESSPSETDSSVAPASSDPADPDGGLPTWVAPVVVVVLFGAAGAVAVVRRRRTGAA